MGAKHYVTDINGSREMALGLCIDVDWEKLPWL